MWEAAKLVILLVGLVLIWSFGFGWVVFVVVDWFGQLCCVVVWLRFDVGWLWLFKTNFLDEKGQQTEKKKKKTNLDAKQKLKKC